MKEYPSSLKCLADTSPITSEQVEPLLFYVQIFVGLTSKNYFKIP